MVVSPAFEQLTVLLESVESSDATLREVTLQEQRPDSDNVITADLTVGVPVLADVSLQDGVSLEAANQINVSHAEVIRRIADDSH